MNCLCCSALSVVQSCSFFGLAHRELLLEGFIIFLFTAVQGMPPSLPHQVSPVKARVLRSETFPNGPSIKISWKENGQVAYLQLVFGLSICCPLEQKQVGSEGKTSAFCITPIMPALPPSYADISGAC